LKPLSVIRLVEASPHGRQLGRDLGGTRPFDLVSPRFK
jgi:hypothetical protein